MDDLSLNKDFQELDAVLAAGGGVGDASRSGDAAQACEGQAEPLDFKDLRDRVLLDDQSAREEVLRALAQAPQRAIRAFFGDLEFNVTALQIEELSRQSSLAADAIHARLAQLKRELGAETASPFERVLIDDCVRSWLYLMAAEDDYVTRHFNTRREREQFFVLCDRAHRRFLSSMKTLAQVRKLALPNVQVNIARKQVNVVGTMRVGR